MQVNKGELTTEKVGKKLKKNFELIKAGGNINEAAAFLSSVAQVMNEEGSQTDADERRQVHTIGIPFVILCLSMFTIHLDLCTLFITSGQKLGK